MSNSAHKAWIWRGKVKKTDALKLFQQAWDEATNDFEKFTSAHYLARHQKNTVDKLRWDEIALQSALKVNDVNIKEAFPSLYLNIAKCYEELNDFSKRKIH